MKNWDRNFVLRMDGITAAFDERSSECCCYLKTLTNARSRRASAVISFPDGEEMRFTLMPYQKTVFHPPLSVAGSVEDISVAFGVERS